MSEIGADGASFFLLEIISVGELSLNSKTLSRNVCAGSPTVKPLYPHDRCC